MAHLKESEAIAASTGSVAAKYNPTSGLLGYVNSPGANPASASRFTSAAAKLSNGSNPYAPPPWPANMPSISDIAPSGSTSLGGGTGGGSIFNAGSYTPDWASLIANDAGFLQSQSTLNASGIANASQRDAAINRGLVNFGGNIDVAAIAKALGVDPSSLSGISGPDIQALAAQNDSAGTSTESRLSDANTKAVRGIKNALNARGLLNSGETGYQLGQQQQSFTQAEYDSRQKLMDYLGQFQQGYLSAQQQLAQQQAADASAAADRQYQANQGFAGHSANWSFTDANGVHVYKDANGNLYNADGTPYTSSAAPAVPAATAAPANSTPAASGNADPTGAAPLTPPVAYVPNTIVRPGQTNRAY